MDVADAAIQVVDAWYRSLDLYQDKLPSKGSVAAALHVLNRLRASYELNIGAHVAGGESQITGLSAAKLKRILAEFGETRTLSSVAGRSNRGARGDIASLLAAMKELKLERLNESSRAELLASMQRHIVDRYVSRYFAVKRVKAMFDPSHPTRTIIAYILGNARQSQKVGAVAEYLVGAKLAVKFPGINIRNKKATASDAQAGYESDFEIGNTVFHVTAAPMPELFYKCRQNLEHGKRVYLLVPDDQVHGARQNSDLQVNGLIAVESIETFIATNVDELAEFDGRRLKSGFRRLLEKYNERVEAVEVDKSLLVEIPPNLD